MQGNIKVVVRCRPLNARELARGATCLVKMEGNQTILQNPKVNDDIKAFTFDRSYWSAGNKTDSDYADQETVYNDVGREWLDHAFAGYNCCIFAYGQTGSGKSFSMMGYGPDKGIIPRTCSDLFDRIHHLSSTQQNFQVEVSYIEIYNERVRDLLNPRTKHLKVREHPILGPYVEDLSRLVVKSFDDIEHLMDEGNKARTVAATNMNETSSRSHAVFTIILTQKSMDEKTNQSTEKVSRFSLVDLAGSERANSTGASGMRLKEGANINRSLTTLGKVIAGLAEQTNTTSTTNSKSNKKKDSFIPYRDSVLTWLLKDSLGGNSKTAMIAAISPADFDETLSTLRYADQAKKIKTKAVVNEDPNVRLIRELKTEIQTLKQSLLAYVPHPEQLEYQQHEQQEQQQQLVDQTGKERITSGSVTQILPSRSIVITDAFGNATELTKREVVEQLKSSQKLLGDIDQSWEERLETTIQIQQERERALVELGITVAKNEMGVYTPKNTPHLVNLNEDPLMSECLVYQIKPGTTLVGRRADDDNDDDNEDNDQVKNKKQYIRLSGSNILENHCRFENVDQVVTIYPNELSVTMVNGIHISEPKQLKSGYRIILGDYHVFRFNHPEEARREREERQQSQEKGTHSIIEETTMNDNISTDMGFSSAATISTTDEADWLYARKEAVMHYFQQQQQQIANNNNPTEGPLSPTYTTSFENLTNEELEKLFDEVTKLRRIRKRQSSHSGSGLSQPMSPCSSTSSFSFRHSATPSTVSTILYENGGYYGSSSSAADDTESMVDREIIRLAREELQQQLDEQKIKYEKRIQRLSCLYPVATDSLSTSTVASLLPPLSPLSPCTGYSDDARIILSRCLKHWQNQRYIHMAETLLVNGATLYEANALARQLDKKVVYQLTIIHNTNVAGSNWEEDDQATRFDRTLLTSRKPCIGVRVIDSKHQCTYLWSLDRLKTRLRYMQGILFTTDETHHLMTGKRNNQFSTNDDDNNDDDDDDDLFYDSHPPRFALIGTAKMRLRHLALHVPMEQTLDVFCQRTCRVMGKLTVLIAPIARSKERHHYHHSNVSGDNNSDNNSNSPTPTTSSVITDGTSIIGDNNTIKQRSSYDALQVGQRLVFEIRIGTLSGINENEFKQIHSQFQLKLFGGDQNDQIYATSTTTAPSSSSSSSSQGYSTINFDYSKAFSMVVTEEMLMAIHHDELTFEVYGEPQPAYLNTFQDEPCASQELPSVETKHNIYTWIEIRELARVSGEYTPVQVKNKRTGSRLDDDEDEAIMTTNMTTPFSQLRKRNDQGIFLLKQGQQRRIVLTIKHDWILPNKNTTLDGDEENEHDRKCGDGLVLWIGDIRLRQDNTTLDDNTPSVSKSITSSSCQDLSIPLVVINKAKDCLVLEGAWDSSMHNSLLLNRLTEPGQTVDLTIKWVFHGAAFQMDLAVQITGDALSNQGLVKRQSLLRNLFTSSNRKRRSGGDADDDIGEEDDESDMTRDGTNESSKITQRYGKKKTSVVGIYRVWERPRRLSSFHVQQEIDSDHHTWQQHQMTKIKVYDQARRRMLMKLDVAHTRYTLALLDLLRKRDASLGSATPWKKEDQTNSIGTSQQSSSTTTQDQLLHHIINQWNSETKQEQTTGLELIHKFGSTDHLTSAKEMNDPIPLYDIHQITLSDGCPSGKNGILMLQHYGYMKMRKLDDNNAKWARRWILLKRPYVLVYANDYETNELDILNIQAVRVNPPTKDLVNTFTVYTKISTYQFQTKDQEEMKEWVASMI
ncbi:uncharacterized protein BX664DRAFT_356510 [Halteromyces radiatus]|uniref:uncharacterized protein n=1 Tax=Halteromyces radiatus TaxID=101107 RepID=UPI00222037F3|nr:uncharacterized protein BX664DRAFT_356510 [Halteromyces radiatus]KAI8097252.1 hypothetical protein BX664DRAFT_356510 [Halteromyces radiatus]